MRSEPRPPGPRGRPQGAAGQGGTALDRDCRASMLQPLASVCRDGSQKEVVYRRGCALDSCLFAPEVSGDGLTAGPRSQAVASRHPWGCVIYTPDLREQQEGFTVLPAELRVVSLAELGDKLGGVDVITVCVVKGMVQARRAYEHLSWSQEVPDVLTRWVGVLWPTHLTRL